MMLPAIQSRLVTLAGGAPNLAAASMHSAFNIANSIGAWLGGATIAAGWGYNSPNLVAVGLGLLGVGIAVYAGQTQGAPVQVGRTTTTTDTTDTPDPVQQRKEAVPDREPVQSA
jgi:DHA1 family inner membrane transport protein